MDIKRVYTLSDGRSALGRVHIPLSYDLGQIGKIYFIAITLKNIYIFININITVTSTITMTINLRQNDHNHSHKLIYNCQPLP